MGINKIVYGGETLVDLTEDTATESDVTQGKVFHLANGDKTTGKAIAIPDDGNVGDVLVKGENNVEWEEKRGLSNTEIENLINAMA